MRVAPGFATEGMKIWGNRSLWSRLVFVRRSSFEENPYVFEENQCDTPFYVAPIGEVKRMDQAARLLFAASLLLGPRDFVLAQDPQPGDSPVSGTDVFSVATQGGGDPGPGPGVPNILIPTIPGGGG